MQYLIFGLNYCRLIELLHLWYNIGQPKFLQILHKCVFLLNKKTNMVFCTCILISPGNFYLKNAIIKKDMSYWLQEKLRNISLRSVKTDNHCEERNNLKQNIDKSVLAIDWHLSYHNNHLSFHICHTQISVLITHDIIIRLEYHT